MHLNYFEKTENGGSGEKSQYAASSSAVAMVARLRKNHDFLFFTLERLREQTSIVTDPQAFSRTVSGDESGGQTSENHPDAILRLEIQRPLGPPAEREHNLFFSYSSQSNIGENDQRRRPTMLRRATSPPIHSILASATLNSVLSSSAVNSFTRDTSIGTT